jgi:hypothetical protein
MGVHSNEFYPGPDAPVTERGIQDIQGRLDYVRDETKNPIEQDNGRIEVKEPGVEQNIIRGTAEIPIKIAEMAISIYGGVIDFALRGLGK